jgi:hypothetical protein
VPLKEAHRSGGAPWDPATKRAYANDTPPHHLVVVSAAENRRKRDKDPAGYMPPSPGARCWYLQAWLAVKRAWALAVDAAEAVAISAVATGC